MIAVEQLYNTSYFHVFILTDNSDNAIASYTFHRDLCGYNWARDKAIEYAENSFENVSNKKLYNLQRNGNRLLINEE
jgi:hypothetical protein